MLQAESVLCTIKKGVWSKKAQRERNEVVIPTTEMYFLQYFLQHEWISKRDKHDPLGFAEAVRMWAPSLVTKGIFLTLLGPVTRVRTLMVVS